MATIINVKLEVFTLLKGSAELIACVDVSNIIDTFPELNEDNNRRLSYPILVVEEVTNEAGYYAEGIACARNIQYDLTLYQKAPSTNDTGFKLIEDITDIIVELMENSGFVNAGIETDFDPEANNDIRIISFTLTNESKLKEVT